MRARTTRTPPNHCHVSRVGRVNVASRGIFSRLCAAQGTDSWKTNESGDLRAIYEPQVTAYAAALNGITGLSAECGVYATVTGEWISCG